MEPKDDTIAGVDWNSIELDDLAPPSPPVGQRAKPAGTPARNPVRPSAIEQGRHAEGALPILDLEVPLQAQGVDPFAAPSQEKLRPDSATSDGRYLPQPGYRQPTNRVPNVGLQESPVGPVPVPQRAAVHRGGVHRGGVQPGPLQPGVMPRQAVQSEYEQHTPQRTAQNVDARFVPPELAQNPADSMSGLEVNHEGIRVGPPLPAPTQPQLQENPTASYWQGVVGDQPSVGMSQRVLLDPEVSRAQARHRRNKALHEETRASYQAARVPWVLIVIATVIGLGGLWFYTSMDSLKQTDFEKAAIAAAGQQRTAPEAGLEAVAHHCVHSGEVLSVEIVRRPDGGYNLDLEMLRGSEKVVGNPRKLDTMFNVEVGSIMRCLFLAGEGLRLKRVAIAQRIPTETGNGIGMKTIEIDVTVHQMNLVEGWRDSRWGSNFALYDDIATAGGRRSYVQQFIGAE